MVFPAVTRPVEESARDATASTPELAAPAPRSGTSAPRGAAHDRFEACLAEVRALEQGHVPLTEHHWAARHRAVGEARNTELTAYWWRHSLMAALNLALVIAVVAVLPTRTFTATALASVAALGIGLGLAWAVMARGGARRLAHWETRLDALDDDATTSREPLTSGDEPSRPSPIAGSSLLIAVFAVFWVALALGSRLAGDYVLTSGLR